MSESGENLKRRIIPGHIDVHPTDNALVVNYTVQATLQRDDGQKEVQEKKNMEKIIRVKALSPKSNINALAHEVVEKCKLIHPNKVKDVEQQLIYLRQRSASPESHKPISIDDESKEYVETGEPPQIEKIDDYIEGLYEEMPDKINATRKILQLARVNSYMESLIENGTLNLTIEALISALTRVLKEDGKKSMELVTNIIYVFFCFSNFSHFHGIIGSYKIGDMCLRVADQEIQRYNIWLQDINKLEKKCMCF